MTKEEIGLLILIIVLAIFFITTIVLKSIAKTKTFVHENKQYLANQKDYVKLLEITPLEMPEYFYKREYKYEIVVKSLDNQQVYNLYILEYDVKVLEVNEDYNLCHDSVVVLEISKNFFSF